MASDKTKVSEWTPEELLKMLRRQVSDVDAARVGLQHAGKTAGDDPELLHVV